MRKVAILGGAFDPVHWGHLLLAETALSQCLLDHLIWVPDPSPPHKRRQSLLGYEHRWQMVKQAIVDRPEFEVLGAQLTHQPSYAIETLLHLNSRYPDVQWYWVIGWDAFQTLPKWYRCEEFVQQCQWLVAPRPTGTQTVTPPFCIESVVQQLALKGMQLKVYPLEMPFCGISSSLIRQYCRQGRSIRYLVPDAVRTYIEVHQLYPADPHPR